MNCDIAQFCMLLLSAEIDMIAQCDEQLAHLLCNHSINLIRRSYLRVKCIINTILVTLKSQKRFWVSYVYLNCIQL